MRTSTRIALAIVSAVVCGIAAAATPAGEAASAPKLRAIPGITAADAFPRGCVDCHVVQPDSKMDVRISTLMRQWQDKVDPAFLARVRAFTPADVPLKGKHPKVSVGEVPQGCLACHARDSTLAPPFDRMLHGLHLVGGAKNHFLTVFQGECTHCHKLDSATGAWSLGGGKEK